MATGRRQEGEARPGLLAVDARRVGAARLGGPPRRVVGLALDARIGIGERVGPSGDLTAELHPRLAVVDEPDEHLPAGQEVEELAGARVELAEAAVAVGERETTGGDLDGVGRAAHLLVDGEPAVLTGEVGEHLVVRRPHTVVPHRAVPDTPVVVGGRVLDDEVEVDVGPALLGSVVAVVDGERLRILDGWGEGRRRPVTGPHTSDPLRRCPTLDLADHVRAVGAGGKVDLDVDVRDRGTAGTTPPWSYGAEAACRPVAGCGRSGAVT